MGTREKQVELLKWQGPQVLPLLSTSIMPLRTYLARKRESKWFKGAEVIFGAFYSRMRDTISGWNNNITKYE